jgi:putative endonuclease
VVKILFGHSQLSEIKKMKTYYLYILTDKKHGALYIDITDNILKSVIEQKNKFDPNQNKKNTCKLVYYEKSGDVLNAISYKKKLQKWDNVWKNILIESFNPEWLDLYNDRKFIEDFPEYFLLEVTN